MREGSAGGRSHLQRLLRGDAHVGVEGEEAVEQVQRVVRDVCEERSLVRRRRVDELDWQSYKNQSLVVSVPRAMDGIVKDNRSPAVALKKHTEVGQRAQAGPRLLRGRAQRREHAPQLCYKPNKSIENACTN